MIIGVAGCASNARVFYEGTRIKKKVAAAVLTTETAEKLHNTGYTQIGTLKSEPTTHGLSVSKKDYEKNPQVVLDSIAPENTDSMADYYTSLDEEVCRAAAKAGGEKVRLEEIKREYPTFSDDTARLMENAMVEGMTVKFVISTKCWSVWKKAD